MDKRKILIADDETNIRLLVRSTLEDEERFEILEATDGREALDHMRAHAPDVLIPDHMIPRVSGLDVLEELNNKLLPRRPRIIVLSAKVNEEQRALKLGADLFLRKPFSLLQLMEVGEQALKQGAS